VRDVGVGVGFVPAPLVVFSHGLGGHRRQSTFLCTHLASHGFVVAAPDHPGSTFADAAPIFARGEQGGWAGLRDWVAAGMVSRPRDVIDLADGLAGGLVASLVGRFDPSRLAVAGHSFGGWTALTTAARDPRVRAVIGLAPAGGRGAYAGDPLAEGVELAWRQEVATLVIAAAEDSILPLAAPRELFARVHSPKRFYALAGADHMHFLDDPARAHDMLRLMPVAARLPGGPPRPFSQLLPARAGRSAVRGLGLAHLDAHTRARAAARAWLAGDLSAALAPVGATLRLD
jgi:predicted dienelactone hydrolase